LGLALERWQVFVFFPWDSKIRVHPCLPPIIGFVVKKFAAICVNSPLAAGRGFDLDSDQAAAKTSAFPQISALGLETAEPWLGNRQTITTMNAMHSHPNPMNPHGKGRMPSGIKYLLINSLTLALTPALPRGEVEVVPASWRFARA